MENNEETKGGIGGGVAFTAFLIILFVGVIFAFSPIAHFYSKWDAWWSKDTSITVSGDLPSEDMEKVWRTRSDANINCEKRAGTKYASPYSVSAASSTSGDTYETYDCWASPMYKI